MESTWSSGWDSLLWGQGGAHLAFRWVTLASPGTSVLDFEETSDQRLRYLGDEGSPGKWHRWRKLPCSRSLLLPKAARMCWLVNQRMLRFRTPTSNVGDLGYHPQLPGSPRESAEGFLGTEWQSHVSLSPVLLPSLPFYVYQSQEHSLRTTLPASFYSRLSFPGQPACGLSFSLWKWFPSFYSPPPAGTIQELFHFRYCNFQFYTFQFDSFLQPL